MTIPMIQPDAIETDAITANYGRFVIGPLERGYGTIIGNALRRVLLSSLQGAAVTSIRVSDVHHEFSTIPYIREDMTQLILQVKKLRLQLAEGTESARLRLEHRGAGTITAADIIVPPEVEIMNTDLYLFTVDTHRTEDGRDTHIEVEFEVRPGRGFSPAEERGRLPIGELPVDAVFSPMVRVNFKVQPTMSEKRLKDRLILEVWTDGTVRPGEACRQSAQLLMRHLTVIAGADLNMVEDDDFSTLPTHEEIMQSNHQAALYEKPIEELDLSVRVFNSLKRTGITTIGDVLDMLDRGPDAMLAIRNFGEKSLDELTEKLRAKGYLKDQNDEDEDEDEEAE